MLQTISKHIQGWIAGTVVVIVAAAFVLFGLEYYISQGGDNQSTVAKVNGVKISARQLNHTVELLQRNYTQQGMVFNEQMQEQLRNIALQQLILDQVLLQTTHKMGFAINPEQIRQEILQIPAFQEKGQFSEQKFQQILSNNGLNPESFINNLQGSLLIEQLSGGLQKSSFITTPELAQIYGLLQQQRSFGYFTLPAAGYIASANPTAEQINTYFQKNKEQFRLPEQIKFSYILLSPENIKSEVTVKPEDVEQFYKEHSSEFAGKTFAEVKENIQQRLSQQQLNQVLAAKSEQLADLSYTNPASLEPAAKALGIAIQTSPWMTSQGIKDDPIFSNTKVLSALFNEDVIKQNNNSQPIELKDGGTLVVRFADRQPSREPTLETVSAQIKQRLQKEQGQKQAGLYAYEIQHSLEKGESIDAIAQRYHLTWTVKNDISRKDKTLSPQLLSAVFTLNPSSDPAKKSVSSVLMENGDYAIIQLEAFRNADFSQVSPEEQGKLRNDLASRWAELEFQLFAKSALDAAKVENKSGDRPG